MTKRTWALLIGCLVIIFFVYNVARGEQILEKVREQEATKSAQLAPSSTPTPKPSPTLEEQSLFILSEVNIYRADNGLVPLEQNMGTCAFAQDRADEIVEDWSHEGFYNDSRRAGYYGVYDYSGENLAKVIDYKDVADAWMESPTHKEVMLSSRYTHGCVKMHMNGIIPYYVLETLE